MARFTVKMRNVTIGWSELEWRDAAMGSANGAFRPGPGYELVQPIFRLFAEGNGDGSEEAADNATLTRYYAARDRLGLSLHADDGRLVQTEFIHIIDSTVERGRDALELHVAVTSSRAWRALDGSGSASPDA